MHAKKIDIDSIGEGLDRKQLLEIKKRFLKINQARLARTRQTLAARQQIFIDLLPLLIHINHPALPGYTSHQCPAGIHSYTPNKTELKSAKTLARSFRFNPRLDQENQIESIFLMGSGGTIAQSKSSDLDVWVCHSPHLSQSERNVLEEKCRKLGLWATGLGLETHFFLMVADEFKAGKLSRFNKESSGSAQHLLLLDEFYRTALLIAGKMPLWWLVPAVREKDYSRHVNLLISRRYIPANDYIDFGPVASLPISEFCGAAIWQFYKAIESPYKSILKLMLLEVYAHQYPNTESLSLWFKQCIYSGELNIDRIDPYFLIYQKLEAYFLEKNDPARLELARRCFYFKVAKPLTQSRQTKQKSWQRQLLEQLVGQWCWDKDYLLALDSRQHWKIGHVIEEKNALVHELTSCYRTLTEFGRRDNKELQIDPKEFAILGRRLHASFERRAGKIDKVNPGISKDLSEPILTFVEHYDEQLHDTKWVLYTSKSLRTKHLKHSSMPTEESFNNFDYGPTTEIKQSRHLIELLVWCYCNQLLTQHTKCDIQTVHSNATEQLLGQIHVAMKRWSKVPFQPASHDNFKKSAFSTDALFIINVGIDPIPHMSERGIQQISDHSDALNYGPECLDLVASIDLVTRNSWNEVEVHHFEGGALLRCLLHFFLNFPFHLQQALNLSVYSATPGYGNTIRQRIEQLLNDLMKCFSSKRTNDSTTACLDKTASQPRYIFQVARHYYSLQFEDKQPKLIEAENEEELQVVLSQKQRQFSALMVDQYALKDSALKLIAGVSDNPAIQVFYFVHSPKPRVIPIQETIANLHVLDEKGSLFTTKVPFQDEKTLLRPLHHFIRAAIDRQSIHETDSLDSFGIYPVEFYRLNSNANAITSKRQTSHTHMERCHIGTEITELPFFSVQAIAQPVAPNHLSFSIFCDNQEFSELQYGPQLFQAVARHILSLRLSLPPSLHEIGQRPCYITDLDLSQCVSLIAPNGQLQISHYLEIKAPLEHKINSALRALG